MLAKLATFIGARWIQVLGVGLLIAGSVGINYKAFVKDTNKTVYTAPSEHKTYEIKVYPFSCVPRIELEKPR